ncbi:hypothetical protein B1H19_07160 [Streptomyces gilvosporeus]|uniref:Uncharacterized protein n=2 Tax=Streptomyces gilvosporeus TaxID=553510 RepID=A0A1V0TM31_9ACTN|nr:hypothetical protein B1H19_07160 [Streptomyces gilvosporeus]
MPPAEAKNSTVFLDWARLQAPEGEGEAQDLIATVTDGLGRAVNKPGRFMDELKRRADRLPTAYLPWFWDTVGHRLGPWLPRHSGTAYGLARTAEKVHGLPVDEAYHRANVLLYARLGALPGKEIAVQQRRLHTTLEAADAHREFLRFLRAFVAGGGAPGNDLHRRVQVSAKAAGLGIAQSAQALGDLLVASTGRPLPDAVLDGLAPLFAQEPPSAPVRQALAELFPTSVTDGAAWLRLLAATGVDDALAEGRIVPAGGLGEWLGRFAFHYSYRGSNSGVRQQPMPDELYALVPRIAARIRAEGREVTLHRSRFRHTLFDADLVDICLANGIAVADPGPRVRLTFCGPAARRDYRALAAHPVFGVRLAGTAYAPRAPRTAAPRLPLAEGTDAALHERVTRLLDAVADGGLGAAQEAMATLDKTLDPPAIAALDGIDTALEALDGVGPLLRTLRAGLPEELAWPALEDAVRSLGGEAAISGVTCTWPVLTVFARDRAIAVDHSGQRGSCAFALPEEAAVHSVFFVGGSFLIGWNTGKRYGRSAERAFWADEPEAVFTPEHALGLVPYGGSTDGALGYQFATPDGGGRYDGTRVLRPGGRAGIDHFEQQLGDGVRIWSSCLFGERRGGRDDAWRELDPETGRRTDNTALPPFLAAAPPAGLFRTHDMQTLAPLPPGAPDSPLGQVDGVSGCRVLHWEHSGGAPVRYLLEGIDGRRATFRVTHPGEDPWGVLRLPEGGAEAVVTDHSPMRCYAATDNSLLWEARSFPHGKRSGAAAADGPMLPPPAFWHFLTPRDTESSKALRTVEADAVQALLAAGTDGDVPDRAQAMRAAAARVLPDVRDPGVLDGVIRAVRTAARLLERRRAVSQRAALIVSGARVRPAAETTDTALVTALRDLLAVSAAHHAPKVPDLPATVAAIAADGAFLRGQIDDATRRVGPPARPRDWAVLLGDGIEAAAWRCLGPATPEEDRAALSALLRTWAASPFAEPGSWRLGRASGEALRPLCATGRAVATGMGDGSQGAAPEPTAELRPTGSYRFVQPASAPAPEGATEIRTVTVTRDDASRLTRLLELLAERGPLRLTPEAVAAFVARSGVRRAVAVHALAGLPTRPGYGETGRLLRAKPFQATASVASAAEALAGRLGIAGRMRVLAAGLPDDPAELWTDAGPVAAAERMADAWTALLGQRTPVDEELSDELEKELGSGEGMAAALGDPRGGGLLTEDLRRVIVANKYGSLYVHPVTADGSPGERPSYDTPYLDAASALSWALTERPVGDRALAGLPALCARLAERLDAPDLLIRLRSHRFALDEERMSALFGPERYEVVALEPPLTDRARPPMYYDQGLLLVQVAGGWSSVFLRPAGFGRPGTYAAMARLCAELGMTELRGEIERIRVLRDGIADLAARAADTPVPVGGYEANPLLSVPDLVDEAAGSLGVGRDAAALYLQLATLARPTDRAVRRWNGWSTARHRTVQAELAATGAVVTEKRSRAGRTAFLPGGWTELKAPHLPLETAKLDAHLAAATEKRELDGPFTRLLPPRPLHEMFAEAWARR